MNAYVKDPWNKIYHNFREREDTYLTKELSKEKFFAADYDAAFYVTHPVGAKVKKDKEGNYKPVDLYSISGGSMWFNGIDNGIIVNRPYMMTNDLDRSVNIYTKKIKKKKQVGRIGQTEFEYSTKNNRYYVLDDFDIKYNPFDDDKKKSTGTDNVEEFTVNNNDDIPF